MKITDIEQGESFSLMDNDSLERIFSLLRSGSGHDFSLYKSNTICRRISRRMTTLGLPDQDTYADYLSDNECEVAVLLKELLIGVTSFFRDAEAYESLKKYLCQQIKSKADEGVFRVWVPACSTGEEAYSTAILLQECLDFINKDIEIQIFASDIDEQAITLARSGLYKSDSMFKTSEVRLNRFFTLTDGDCYRIQPEIREQIVFAVQSVIKDPPFTRIDLLSCRNLLIYLGPQLQKKLLPLFHYSLNPGGLLFLGASESIGGFFDYYDCLDKKHKIYRRKEFEFVTRSKLKFPITRLQPKTRLDSRVEKKDL